MKARDTSLRAIVVFTTIARTEVPLGFICTFLGITGSVTSEVPALILFPARLHDRQKDMNKMTLNNEAPFRRKSRINKNRDCYLDKDFNYVYKRPVKQSDGTYKNEEFKIPYSEENRDVFILLDSVDHESELRDRYEEENKDWKFQNKLDKHYSEIANGDDGEFRDDPIDCIADPDSDVFERAFPEYMEATPEELRCKEVREWISSLPESQQNLIFDHLGGEQKFLEEIRREEEQETGKKITKQAMHNRWDKILTKACKHYGVEKQKQKRKPS